MSTKHRPLIHLNGTSAESLARDLEAAGLALRIALDALQACSPNGRDYYCSPDSTIGGAQDEHAARVEALAAVLSDLQDLHEHVLS